MRRGLAFFLLCVAAVTSVHAQQRMPGTKDDLKPGERIFTNAKPDGSRFVASRITVSKDGVNPPQ